MDLLDGTGALCAKWHMSVAERVKAIRERLDLTQVEVAERSGGAVTQDIVAKLESGKNKGNGAQTRQGLASAFGLTLDTISAYLDGKIGLDDALQKTKSIENARLNPAPTVDIEDAQSPLEAALGQAFDAKKHTLKDLDAVRSSLRKTHQWQFPEADLVEAAGLWLNAAARLRRAGKPVDAESIVYALTLGTKALPHQIERAERRDAAAAAEAEAELREIGGEPGQGAAMGERLKKLAKKQQSDD